MAGKLHKRNLPVFSCCFLVCPINGKPVFLRQKQNLLKRTKIISLFILAVAWIQVAVAQPASTDTTLIRRSWFVVPILSYQQETSFGPGVAGGFYFKSHDLKRISSISYSAIYTFLNQFTVNVSPKIYIDKEHRCYLYSNMGFKNYPNKFYGVGNTWSGLEINYTSRNAYLNLQPQYEICKHLFVGAQVSLRYENVLYPSESAAVVDSIKQVLGAAGWTEYFQAGIGVTASYDTRDNHFYPTKGLFAKVLAVYYPSFVSSYPMGNVTLDYRQYVTTWHGQVLAWQVYANGVFGRQIPFAMLPTLGGSDLMRGFRENKFSDMFSFVGQVEYRVPLFWRLKATAFCSAGDVLNWRQPHIDKLKFAYGLGLRCRLNDARVHLRVDVAMNNYECKPQFYITATEAF